MLEDVNVEHEDKKEDKKFYQIHFVSSSSGIIYIYFKDLKMNYFLQIFLLSQQAPVSFQSKCTKQGRSQNLKEVP